MIPGQNQQAILACICCDEEPPPPDDECDPAICACATSYVVTKHYTFGEQQSCVVYMGTPPCGCDGWGGGTAFVNATPHPDTMSVAISGSYTGSPAAWAISGTSQYNGGPGCSDGPQPHVGYNSDAQTICPPGDYAKALLTADPAWGEDYWCGAYYTVS